MPVGPFYQHGTTAVILPLLRNPRDPDQARELQWVLDSELLQAEYLEATPAESPELQLVLEAELR